MYMYTYLHTFMAFQTRQTLLLTYTDGHIYWTLSSF